MNGLGNKGNSLAEFVVTIAMMATLATTAAPRFSAIGEKAKARKTKANMEKILKASEFWYNHQIEVTGMGKFPTQSHRTDNVGSIEDENNNRRIDVEELDGAEFVSIWSDTLFLHLFDNDTIKSPYQDGGYEYAIIGGSGTGNEIISPIFVIVDIEEVEDFFLYYKP